MKALSIIGILFSLIGLALSVTIFVLVHDFQGEINNLYFEQNPEIYYQINDLMRNKLEIVRETIPPTMMVFFSFFMFLSIKLNINS